MTTIIIGDGRRSIAVQAHKAVVVKSYPLALFSYVAAVVILTDK